MKYYFLALSIFIHGHIAEAQDSNLFRILEGGKFGFIDNKGKVVIKPVFNYAYDFSEGVAVARKDGKYGYINKAGNWAIMPEYDFAQKFQNGLAVVTIKGKSFLISKNPGFKFLKGFEFLQPSCVRNLYWFNENGKSGLCNAEGKILLQPILNQYQDFELNYALVEDIVTGDGKIKQRTALVDTTGEFIIPFGKYDFIHKMGEGFICAGKYQDSSNKVNHDWEIKLLTPSLNPVNCKFSTYFNFLYTYSEGLIKIFLPKKPVMLYIDGQYNNDDFYVAFADTLGKIVINDTSFSQATDFKFGLAVVLKNGKIEVIDKTGKSIPGIAAATFRASYGTDKSSFKYDAQRYIAIEKDCIKSYTFEKADSNLVVNNVYDHKGNFKYACDISSFLAYYVEECSTVKSPMDIVKSKYNIHNYDRGGFVNGLLCAAIDYKLFYVNKEGKIVWKQTTRIINKKGVHYYSNTIREVTIKENADYKCGEESKELIVANLSDPDRLRNHYEILNTSCDTIELRGMEIMWGGMINMFYDYSFGKAPVLYHRECELTTAEDGLSKTIPPKHSLQFTTPKTSGCSKTLFRVNVKGMLLDKNNSSTWQEINVSSVPVEGMITPEIYNHGWLGFIDDYYYRSLHQEYQNSPK